jgi:hypothetical protein
MNQVPKGQLTTVSRIAETLARAHAATVGCSVTTGIFAWIAAYAANEAERKGKKRVFPYWRVLKAGGELNSKYPGGVENLIGRLESEGHEVLQRGRRYFVQDYERKLANLWLSETFCINSGDLSWRGTGRIDAMSFSDSP